MLISYFHLFSILSVLGLGEESYPGEGKRIEVRTPLPFTLPLIQILTNPALTLVHHLPYILYQRRMKKGEERTKIKLSVKKEGREMRKKKKEKENNN